MHRHRAHAPRPRHRRAEAATASGGPLDVYAAASLAEVFPQIDPDARFSFAGSDELATQIREGAPADVYAAASSKYPQELFDEGLVEEPVTFASNRLVLIVPRGNPAGDRERRRTCCEPGTRLVVAAEGVPVGDYTRTVLETLGLSAALDNVVSNEDDVKGVAGKVALGEADAGFVYATDVMPVREAVRVIELPEGSQPPDRVPGRGRRVDATTKDAARAFVETATQRGRTRRASGPPASSSPSRPPAATRSAGSTHGPPARFGEIRERHAAEQRDGRVAHLLPDVAERAPDHHRTRLRVVPRRAADRRQRPLEETDDPLERDLLGVLVEPVAARRPALRADDPGRAHGGHHLLENRLRHGRPSSELLELERTATLERQREDRSRRVVGSSAIPTSALLSPVVA